MAAFNLLETFVSDRWEELATYMNGGHTQFLDLSERMQARAIRQTLSVAQTRLRRDSMDLTELRTFSSEIGDSLTAMTTTLRLAPLTWLWEGSNMSAASFNDGLRFINVAKPWDSILDVSGRLGFPTVDSLGDPIDLKEDLASLARERHKCAHVASHGVTTIWLRAVPNRILRFALGFDILASLGAHQLRAGNADFLQDDKWLDPSRVSLTFVRERSRDHAELLEGRSRAAHVDVDGDKLFSDACSRPSNEVVVRQDVSGLAVDWSISGPG